MLYKAFESSSSSSSSPSSSSPSLPSPPPPPTSGDGNEGGGQTEEGVKGAGSNDGDGDGDDESGTDAEAMCYVCTDNGDTDEDPLVNPCKCKGGTKYVHVSCLRQWVIKDKDEGICKVTSQGGTNCYKCSVCKSPYRYEVKRKGKTTEIFDRSVKAPSLTCMVVMSSDNSILPRGKLYQISFESLIREDNLRPVSLGRNSECDVILQCSSVSNHHAKIHFTDNNFYLVDDSSSNGTHTYLRAPLKSEKGKEAKVRIGRSTIRVQPTEYWKAR